MIHFFEGCNLEYFPEQCWDLAKALRFVLLFLVYYEPMTVSGAISLTVRLTSYPKDML